VSGPFVTRLGVEAGRRLRDAIGHEAFAFRTVPHARWSARGEDVVVTYYVSGKLVVQGAGTEVFVARHLPDAAPAAREGAAVEPVHGPVIGSDESGKGDYFGPLVVAAALVGPDDVNDLASMRVMDSKAATDAHVRRVEGALADRLPHAVEVLEPEAYNAAYAEEQNVNRLLGRLHAKAIDAVLAQAGAEAARVRIVVDRFGAPDHVRRHLGAAARGRPLSMKVRGESHPAVAAASFLARAAFLRSFERLKGDAGGELYLGASDPRILPLTRRLLAEGGEAWLGRFAKLHFKTTRKARRQ
jgi:ribonuclease HIII